MGILGTDRWSVDGTDVKHADLVTLIAGGDPGVTAGTVAAGKAVVVDSNKRADAMCIGTLSLGAGAGTAVTATAAEINVLHGVTAGTAAASSAAVLDANKALDVVRTASLRLGASGSETTVTATAAEINELHGAPFTISQVSTPASGSNGTQFTFKDAGGSAVAVPVSGMFYVSKSATGLTVDAADTGVAVLTNGVVEAVIAAKLYHFVTTAAGLMGLTLTAAAGSWYIAFILPNGKVLCSTVLTVN